MPHRHHIYLLIPSCLVLLFTHLAVGGERHHVPRELVDGVAVGGDALLERLLQPLVVAGRVD